MGHFQGQPTGAGELLRQVGGEQAEIVPSVVSLSERRHPELHPAALEALVGAPGPGEVVQAEGLEFVEDHQLNQVEFTAGEGVDRVLEQQRPRQRVEVVVDAPEQDLAGEDIFRIPAVVDFQRYRLRSGQDGGVLEPVETRDSPSRNHLSGEGVVRTGQGEADPIPCGILQIQIDAGELARVSGQLGAFHVGQEIAIQHVRALLLQLEVGAGVAQRVLKPRGAVPHDRVGLQERIQVEHPVGVGGPIQALAGVVRGGEQSPRKRRAFVEERQAPVGSPLRRGGVLADLRIGTGR